MSNLLEITGDDIARLDDGDLRELIGQLCEADYRAAGLPTKGIMWGGNQDAKDGGLDVIVRDEVEPPKNSFVPRSTTGFQVKKPAMSAANILKEMRPNGDLREEIKALIQTKGAYIIISSGASTTGSALKKRVDAMREAVSREENQNDLCLDFYDRNRVATWLRAYPSLILWVRKRIGREITGWRPYGNWANAPGGVQEEYILDEGLRLMDGALVKDKGMSALEGLQRLRSTLSKPRASVRLTGLSGVGKTRMLQAMFDERIGESVPNLSEVVYTDISDGPDPDPVTFAGQIISDKTKTIMIVDNCPPELHSRLTKIVCSHESNGNLSLLTVEYDVRDDVPEETNVFRLEPASEEVIEKLISKRFSHISQVDARTIAKFSGGNARIAISLASTVDKGETVSGFRNEELFKRLFHQRNDSNENLLASAEVCSLVYSFEGTDTDSETSELKLLASLAGKPGTDLYRDIEILKKRDLIQSRDVWRAILPQAIANRLAKQALESIPKDTIRSFYQNAPERLLKSFTRRLGYLHDCEAAVGIVNDWLASNGWIGKENCNLNQLGMVIFKNIAPVLPEKALEAMERAANGDKGRRFTSRENIYYYEFVRLLRHLAYDPKLFKRSIALMICFALSEAPDEKNNSTRDVLKSLFPIFLSGTHATTEARAEIIEELIDSGDQNKQNLALILLDEALEAWHFGSSYTFDFGARSRDYGYRPRTHGEIVHWYKTFVGICTRLATSDKPIAQKARKLLSDKMRGLWTKAGIFDVLEESAKQIHEQQAWNEGWLATKDIIRFDSAGFEKETLEKLHNLERLLKPKDLLERARTFALSGEHHSFELEDDFEEKARDPHAARTRMQETTREIGTQVAKDLTVFHILLPELVSTQNVRIFTFGKGLADGCDSKEEFWQILSEQFKKTPLKKRQYGILMGFLSACAETDREFYESTLDSFINDDVFCELLPIFQTTSVIDQRGIQRLHGALDTGKTDIDGFRYLAWGGSHEPISDDDLAELITKIVSKDKGTGVAVDILTMRFHHEKEAPREYSAKLIAAAREMLSEFPFSDERIRHDGADYELSNIANICLRGDEGIDATKEVCEHLADAIRDNQVYAFDYPDLLNALARVHPIVFLDVFVQNEDIRDYQAFDDDIARRDNPLNQVAEEDIIAWCEEDPESRYPLVASAIQPFSKSSETGKLHWGSIVYSIFDKAPDLSRILQHLSKSVRPSGWSGSLADILERRSVLFQELYNHRNPEIAAWAKREYTALQKSIRGTREWEESMDRKRSESFE